MNFYEALVISILNLFEQSRKSSSKSQKPSKTTKRVNVLNVLAQFHRCLVFDSVSGAHHKGTALREPQHIERTAHS